jgi:hypothetical protein
LSIRLQADYDLTFAIVKTVRQREPSIDFASARDSGLYGLSDAEILDRAAAENRVLVSYDRRTMLNHLHRHLMSGKSSPGRVIVSQSIAIGAAADALILLWAAADPLELREQAFHLPSFLRHAFVR